jgi:hypothetical protein
LLDLYASGYVEAACMNAPRVAHVGRHCGLTADDDPNTVAKTHSTFVVADDGDAVIALSQAATRLLTPHALGAVAEALPTFPGPCVLRDELLRHTDRAPTHPAPPMAVLMRPA